MRLGTAEIYTEVEKFKEIQESIVIGQSWKNDIRIILFVVLNKGYNLDDEIKSNFKKLIGDVTKANLNQKIMAIESTETNGRFLKDAQDTAGE